MDAQPISGFMRLFVAVPAALEVREEIGRAQGKLKRNSPPGVVRWTQLDQFHITLKFLGDVQVEHVAKLEDSLRPLCARSPALQLSARGIGFFPNTHKPRVIWVGAHDEHGQLTELHRRIDEALRWLAPTERPEKFVGHITLARFKPGHQAAAQRLVKLAAGFHDRNFGDWRANEIELVRSELTSARAEHTAIATFSLAR